MGRKSRLVAENKAKWPPLFCYVIDHWAHILMQDYFYRIPGAILSSNAVYLS